MIEKSAAWEAGAQDAMEKEAGLGSLLSAGRAAVNKGGAALAGKAGKRLGGRVGQAADIVAAGGRSQAARSTGVVRKANQVAARKATAKGLRKDIAKGTSKNIAGMKNPAQRVAARQEVAKTQKRVTQKIVSPKPKVTTTTAVGTAKKNVKATANKAGGKVISIANRLKRPAALLGAGGTIGAVGASAVSGGAGVQQQQPGM
jgi:hypothetical protein